ncbi:MAG: glycerol-3-phosphate 1-O-acyltransferase PlsY [Chloroflexi bacterium]|nr:glycerol-3-phosphate 1-O-acyltransferase PlsY [Chloroflexota bacterium]MCH7655719.1 glycerol-3-phosphate 1-O-acyltransferase PlsY [Chloroflexota bacterium]
MEWLLVPVAYVIGSVQPGLIVVKLTMHVDVRTLGSGRTGMTNVLRSAGKRAAAVVFAADAGKGVALTLAARLLSDDAIVHAAVGTAVIVGHVWPVFAGFRGGRGIATGVAASLGLDPWTALVGVAAFVPVLAAFRYVSLASIVSVAAAVAAFAVRTALFDAPAAYVGYAIVGATVIIAMHRDNIGRLRRGEERRLGGPAA